MIALYLYMPPAHVTVTTLRLLGHSYLGRRMRIASVDDYSSPSNPDGITLPRPLLLRSTNSEHLPTYGEQVIEPGVVYIFGGASDGRTLVFINESTNVPLQIFNHELPGAVFVIDP